MSRALLHHPLAAVLASALTALLLLAACSTKAPVVYTGWYKEINGCKEEYAAIDARVDAAGVRDAAYYRVPGFPYLRTDRLLASYGAQIQSPDDEVGAGWVRRMREMDQEAREFEYINLGMSLKEQAIQRFRFINCSRGLAGIELDNPAAFKRLKAAVKPPDEYSDVARTLGLYPLAVPVLRAQVRAEQAQVQRDFAQPLAELDAPGPLALWTVHPQKDAELVADGFQSAFIDELGLPGLVDSQWQALAEKFAPQLWIENRDERDHPGTPVLTAQGASVDSSQPLMNFTIGFARFGDLPVVQITYFTWFKLQTQTQAGGGIDGIMWRVTLDLQAQPLVYESLHASGRAHAWFPVQPLVRRQQASYWQEPDLFPQTTLAPTRAVLRLKAGSHALRRIVSPEQATATETHTYELRRYEDLYTLPLPNGGSRSLFDGNGLIAGSGQAPLWLRSSGIRAPGALRQYGHHATRYVGRSQFDEPFLLDSVFIAPKTQKPIAPGASPEQDTIILRELTEGPRLALRNTAAP